jgi:hypothetical protein
MGFALANNVIGCGLSDGLNPKPEFAKANSTYKISQDFSSSGFIQWSSLINFNISSSPQFVKTKSSHPLSLLNFNKTRPRGIPPQEPMPKNLIFSHSILIYPPYQSSFIDPTPFLSYFLIWADAVTIRPPPVQ